MSKRKRGKFEPSPLDFYPTPLKAVVPLIPHLNGARRFAEPCCGEGHLVRHLESFGLTCVYASDKSQGQDALACDNYGDIDKIITNPPFSDDSWEELKRLMLHFTNIAPTWLLLPLDFMANERFAPFLATCTDVIPIGRVQWVKDEKNDSSTENFAWYHFKQGHCAGPKIHPPFGRRKRYQQVAKGDLNIQPIQSCSEKSQNETHPNGRQLGRHGGARHKGQKQAAVGNLKYGTNSRAYILARLDRDGHTELAGKVRTGEISARAAATSAHRR
jgi:hypothetical protein